MHRLLDQSGSVETALNMVGRVHHGASVAWLLMRMRHDENKGGHNSLAPVLMREVNADRRLAEIRTEGSVWFLWLLNGASDEPFGSLI